LALGLLISRWIDTSTPDKRTLLPNNTTHMKPNYLLSTLGALAVTALFANAQDAVAPATQETQPADVAQVQPATPAPAAEAPAAVPEAAPAETTSPASAVIPLIVIDDTPLLDAIRNLARQAGINLMIDPKVAYGQADQTGKPTPQPSVSIRWENITAEQALNALLNNYGLQAVADPKVKITRVTIKDPAAPDPLMTKTIQLQYASPSNVLAAVTASLSDKRSKVVPDNRTSQLVIVATEKELTLVESLIAKLDTITKQVLIEARLVETAMNPSTVKGIDWSGTLKNQNVAFGNNNQAGPVPADSTIAPLSSLYPKMIMEGASFSPATAFLNADGLSATLSFLNNNTESKILSSPRTVTLDNDTAHIEVGTEYPIINVTAGTANSTGGSQISYSNLTVRLDVTPRISANNNINLKVSPRVMRLDSVQKFNVGGSSFDVPIFATRTIDTSVMIPSGNTLVMGGLIQDNTTKGNVKVPVLGDIPGLGLLFRQDKKSRDKQNLIVFITPTIVEDSDFQPAKTDYLKTPMPDVDHGDPDWTAWDSGKPKSWSK
jgi:type II secretory pathway component GspD/PulD (secretin)